MGDASHLDVSHDLTTGRAVCVVVVLVVKSGDNGSAAVVLFVSILSQHKLLHQLELPLVASGQLLMA